jgi:hypothetical protein
MSPNDPEDPGGTEGSCPSTSAPQPSPGLPVTFLAGGAYTVLPPTALNTAYQIVENATVNFEVAQDENQTFGQGSQAAYIYPCLQNMSDRSIVQFPEYAVYVTDANVSNDGYQVTMSVAGGQTMQVFTTVEYQVGVCLAPVCTGSPVPNDYPQGAAYGQDNNNAYVSGFVQVSIVPQAD